jgi:hypothetical protein
MGNSTQLRGSLKLDRPLDAQTAQLVDNVASFRPKSPPGSYSCWRASVDMAYIEPVGVYDKCPLFVYWLKTIIKHVLKGKGYRLMGTINWHGEDEGDRGMLQVIGDRIFVNGDYGDRYLEPEEPDDGHLYVIYPDHCGGSEEEENQEDHDRDSGRIMMEKAVEEMRDAVTDIKMRLESLERAVDDINKHGT